MYVPWHETPIIFNPESSPARRGKLSLQQTDCLARDWHLPQPYHAVSRVNAQNSPPSPISANSYAPVKHTWLFNLLVWTTLPAGPSPRANQKAFSHISRLPSSGKKSQHKPQRYLPNQRVFLKLMKNEFVYCFL